MPLGFYFEYAESTQRGFRKKYCIFLRSSVLTSFDYLNEPPTLTERKKKLEISVRDKLDDIKMIPKLIISTDCAGAEERDQMYRKDVMEVLQKHFFQQKKKMLDYFFSGKNFAKVRFQHQTLTDV